MKPITENERGLWDAFVEFMENCYWEGCLEDFTQEAIDFQWNEFSQYTVAFN